MCMCQFQSSSLSFPPLSPLSNHNVFYACESVLYIDSVQFSSVQPLSRVRLFVTPWTTACQASLSITNSQSPSKPVSESAMPSNHLILCHPLLLLSSIFPSIRVFSNESALHISGQSIGVSASTSVLPMNTQDWSPLGWTGWISLQSKGLSRVFSNTAVQKHQFFGTQLSLESNSHMHTWPLANIDSSVLFFRLHIQMISYSICLSPSDLHHLVWQSLGLSMLLQMALFPFFMAVYYSVVYMYLIFIHPLSMDI